MHQFTVKVEVGDKHYRAYLHEAERRGVSVESLVEETVQHLFEEFERQRTDDDHPITIC